MITKLKNCTPEFVRKCCPEQSGDVIFFNSTILLLTEGSVLSVSAVSVRLCSPEGEFKWWWGNGQLVEHCHYVDRKYEGEYKSWHENGQLWKQCYYVNGKLEGERKVWHEDGRLWEHELWKTEN